MRTTQFMGLSDSARRYLEKEAAVDRFELIKNDVVEKTWESPKKLEKGKFHAYGMFEEVIKLDSFVLKTGVAIHEKVQRVEWSSGPMIFTCLVNDDDIVLIEWSEGELEKSV